MKAFNKTRSYNYWLIYSFVWIITALFVFSGILFYDKSFVISTDGFTQHYVALKYYGIYLRQIFKDLIHLHRLMIPDWDFCIGEGSDILKTLHYYCIGDPLALFSFFVPAEYTHYLYTFLGLLRLYLAGAAFSLLAFGTGQKNKVAVLAGAVSYSLCYWGITCASGHPFFANPMIYFPLMILGIERIIIQKKYCVFVIFTALSAVSNLYFFYIIALLTVCYTFVRLALMAEYDIKGKILQIIKIGISAIVGVCIPGAVLLPVALSYIGDSRLSSGQPFHLFYPFYHYTSLPGSFISASPTYAATGLAVPVLIAVICIFIDRRTDGSLKRLLRVLLVMSFIFILFPVFGRIFNLMSYMTNRWIFAFFLLCSYILTYEWDFLLALDTADIKKIFLSGTVLYCLCLAFKDSRLTMAFAMMCLFFITLVFLNRELFHSQNRVLLLTIFSVAFFGIWHFSPSFNEGSKNHLKNHEIADKVSSTAESMFASEMGIQGKTGAEVLRVSGRDFTRNANILNRFSSTQYYWSMSNSYITDYRALMELPDPSVYSFTNYDDRTALTALSSVRYYITKEDNCTGIPYGFIPLLTKNSRENLTGRYADKLRTELGSEPTPAQLDYIKNYFYDPYTIFENEYPLPLTYCYDSYIGEDVYEAASPLAKQQLGLETCMVKEPVSSVGEFKGSIPDFEIPCTVKGNSDEISYTGTGFITTGYNTSASVTFSAPSNAETYIRITGLDFKQTAGYDLYFGDDSVDPNKLYGRTEYGLLSVEEKNDLKNEKRHMRYDDDVNIYISSGNGLTKSFNYRTAEAPFSSGRHDYIINMGYNTEPVTSITLTFPLRGLYSVDDIEVYSIPMDGYTDKISALGEFHLENMIYDTDSISGTIDLPSPRILTASIPFSKGWTARVDGVPVPVFAVNGHYLGIEVKEGEHNVSFVYSTPLKKGGFVLSALGILAFILLIADSRINLIKRGTYGKLYGSKETRNDTSGES